MRRADSRQRSFRPIANTTSRRSPRTRASWRESSRRPGALSPWRSNELRYRRVLSGADESYQSPLLLVGPQLDGVAVGVENPELTAGAHVGWGFEKLDPHILEGALGLLEVGHLERDMYTERIGLAPVVLARDQVNRVLAHAVPRSRKWKIGPGKFLETEHAFIKPGGAFGVGDAHRAMAEAFDLDHPSSPRRASTDFAALHG